MSQIQNSCLNAETLLKPITFMGLAFLAGSNRFIQYFPEASKGGLLVAAGLISVSSCIYDCTVHDSDEFNVLLGKVAVIALATICSGYLAQSLKGHVSLSFESAFKLGCLELVCAVILQKVFQERNNQPNQPFPPIPQDLSNRHVLARVFAETKGVLDSGFYTLDDGKRVNLNLVPMKEGTRVWTNDALLQELDLTGKPTYETTFEVVNQDTVLAGRRLLKEGYGNPLLLNMANRYSPGGGVVGGARAQEEECCRTTALYVSISPRDNPHIREHIMHDGKYLIPECGCIYSPHVPVIRERKEDRFVYLSEENPELSFVSSPSYCVGDHRDLQPGSPNFEKNMRLKIQSQILCALVHGHDSLVLGAYGCGAFSQDPKIISQWYAEELAPYQKYFRKICFAVLVARPSDQDNFDAFKERFPPV